MTTTTQTQTVLSVNSNVKILFRKDMGRTKQQFSKNFLNFQKLDKEIGCEYIPKSKTLKATNTKKQFCYWKGDDHMVFTDENKKESTDLTLGVDCAIIETPRGCKYTYYYSSTTLVFEGKFQDLFQDELIPELFLISMKEVHPKTKLFFWNTKNYFVSTIWEEHIFRLAHSNFGLETTSFNIPEYDEVKAYSVLNWISEDEAEEIIFKRDRFNGSQNATKRIH